MIIFCLASFNSNNFNNKEKIDINPYLSFILEKLRKSNDKIEQNLYEKYVSQKVDYSFIDCVFDDIDNYLGNIKVTKDLNNILCYLCLYNEDLANYIKQKGGLSNVLEELKLNINTNDKNSQFMKLNSLKMLYKICRKIYKH